uniref:FLYWCH-type domain-containing protein n=1 Tax=Trichuris muris TaxID=70415 RepID=A0A5S6R2K8_TRIMR
MPVEFRRFKKSIGDENVVICYLQDREKESLRGRRWRCNNRVCRKQLSLRSGTWFEGCKVDFCTAVKFMYAWNHGYTAIRFCYDQLGVTTFTCFNSYCSNRQLIDMCKKSA